VNVFIQGFRRSGTTFLYDVFLEDERFACYYEPLGMGVESVGGGSGAHEVDVSGSVREKRAGFLTRHPEWAERSPHFAALNLLNYGAPRLAELEFEPDLPQYAYDYLRYLVEGQPNAVLKFTRMYCKPHCLARVDPTATFVHIVRDPRFVAVSYLFGRGRTRERKFRRLDGRISMKRFFTRRTTGNPWSVRSFSEVIRRLPGFVDDDPSDLGRVLMAWRYVFESTHRLGRSAFGDRYVLLRHEDLANHPERTLAALYDAVGAPLPEKVCAWAVANARAPQAAIGEGDRRWREAFDRYGLGDALAAAGYGSIVG
jgi:hypothetical protein